MEKTHKLGAKLFKISAIISLFGLLSTYYAILFVIVPVVAAAAVLIAYSYFEFNKERAKEEALPEDRNKDLRGKTKGLAVYGIIG